MENQKIIEEIFMTCIRVNNQSNVFAAVEFYGKDNRLTVTLETRPDMKWPEDLTRKWSVRISNAKALNSILKEVKGLELEIENSKTDEEDLLGD